MKDAPKVRESKEKPDRWWYKVYFLVVLFTIVTIAALGLFSRYFSG